MADMRDPDRPSMPAGRLARLLVAALGLIGFMVTPATAATTVPAVASASVGIGVRAGVVQNAPARGRASHSRPDVRADTAAVTLAASARHIAGAPAQVPPAALPASGVPVAPPSGPIVWSDAVVTPLTAVPRGVPRGRAPPLSTRI